MKRISAFLLVIIMTLILTTIVTASKPQYEDNEFIHNEKNRSVIGYINTDDKMSNITIRYSKNFLLEEWRYDLFNEKLPLLEVEAIGKCLNNLKEGLMLQEPTLIGPINEHTQWNLIPYMNLHAFYGYDVPPSDGGWAFFDMIGLADGKVTMQFEDVYYRFICVWNEDLERNEWLLEYVAEGEDIYLIK